MVCMPSMSGSFKSAINTSGASLRIFSRAAAPLWATIGIIPSRCKYSESWAQIPSCVVDDEDLVACDGHCGLSPPFRAWRTG